MVPWWSALLLRMQAIDSLCSRFGTANLCQTQKEVTFISFDSYDSSVVNLLLNGCPASTFQNRFDNLFRKYITYTGGEELFGLPVTQHPQLLEIRKQLTLLQKLYGLYNNVIETVNGYYDILWADIHIEKINNELLDFQTRFIDTLLMIGCGVLEL